VSLVFLSYASEDDLTPGGTPGGWVTIIEQALQFELRRLKGVKLWRDRRDFNLPGPVRDRLSDVIRQADFLLPVISHDYNSKSYTVFEIGEFLRRLGASNRKAVDYIVPLLPRPFPEDEFLDELSGLKWVQFFEPSAATSYTPFVEADGKQSEKFWGAVRQVVKLIEEQIKTAPADPPKATVYLARAADEQIDFRLTVSNELDSKHCRITPRPPWPVSEADARTFLSNSLAQSQFSIHLLGATPGREQRSGLGGLSTLQLDLAAERQKKDARFRRLIWMQPDIKPSDPLQKALIDSLENGTRLSARDEFVRGGIEAFKEVIHDELARVAALPQQPPQVAAQ
jgi:hypothetical protein